MPVDFEFADKTLREIAAAIMEKCRLAVFLDQKALEEAGIKLDQRITRRLPGVKLRDAAWTGSCKVWIWPGSRVTMY